MSSLCAWYVDHDVASRSCRAAFSHGFSTSAAWETEEELWATGLNNGLNWSELGCWFWQCDNGMTIGMHRQSLVEASAKALSHCYLSLLWNETCASLCVWTFLRLHRALALFEGEGQHLKHHEPCFGLWFYLPTSFERAHLFERCQPKDPRIRAARLPFTGQHDALLCKFRVFTIHENCPPLKAIRK